MINKILVSEAAAGLLGYIFKNRINIIDFFAIWSCKGLSDAQIFVLEKSEEKGIISKQAKALLIDNINKKKELANHLEPELIRALRERYGK